MSEPPPSPVSAARSARARAAALGRSAVGLYAAVASWPGGRFPVPTITSLLLIAGLIVAVVELLPKSFFDVTLTVRARTEVLEVELEPERKYLWWLPRGAYALVKPTEGAGCDHRSPYDVACRYDEPTSLTIENGATVRFEVAPSPADHPLSFTVALIPKPPAQGSRASLFEVRNAANERLIATSDLLTFESVPVESWRIPLLIGRVAIGESLTEGVAAADALAPAARQPILTEGEVRVFARPAAFFDSRYEIKEERFDPADVVQIPADARRRGLLRGLLALDAAEQRDFDVTLHTDVTDVFVRRLGAEHEIGVSKWAIVSKLPPWLALWAVWVSLIVVSNYHSDRLGELRGHKNEQRKA